MDVDGVLADFNTHVGDTCGDNPGAYELGLHAVEFQNISRFRAAEKIVRKKNWCDGVPLMLGANDFIREAEQIGDVWFVTKPYAGAIFWREERRRWLTRNFGNQYQSRVRFVDYKSTVDGDVLVDDTYVQCYEWSRKHEKFSLHRVSCSTTETEMSENVKRVFSYENILHNLESIKENRYGNQETTT